MTYHLCIDIRGALKWPKRQLDGLMVKDGRRLRPSEVTDILFDELAKGRCVLPLGKPCEGFDYTTGCPGHTEREEKYGT